MGMTKTDNGEEKFEFTDEMGCRLLVMHDSAGLTVSVSKGDAKVPSAIAYMDDCDAETLYEALGVMLGYAEG